VPTEFEVRSPILLHDHLLGRIHLLAALVAMFAGALALLLKKGTRVHRLVGLVYVGSMLGLNGTAFFIYELFGGFGPFHWAASVSLVSVLAGWLPARRRGRSAGWRRRHAYWMCGSYVGLLAAAVSEISTRYLDTPFGPTVVAASALVIVTGLVLIWRLVPPLLRPATPGEERWRVP
jgi:uncharacterized membrane protein